MLIVSDECMGANVDHIAQYLAEDVITGKICYVQSSRMSTISVATSVAEKLSYNLGDKVGYHIPLEDFRSSGSVIE